jgi:hypothetical protein
MILDKVQIINKTMVIVEKIKRQVIWEMVQIKIIKKMELSVKIMKMIVFQKELTIIVVIR